MSNAVSTFEVSGIPTETLRTLAYTAITLENSASTLVYTAIPLENSASTLAYTAITLGNSASTLVYTAITLFLGVFFYTILPTEAQSCC